jgi:hypothetical protein
MGGNDQVGYDHPMKPDTNHKPEDMSDDLHYTPLPVNSEQIRDTNGTQADGACDLWGR